MGLVAPWHVRSSWTRAQTRVPCIGRQILNHCATREVPPCLFFKVTPHLEMMSPHCCLWSRHTCYMVSISVINTTLKFFFFLNHIFPIKNDTSLVPLQKVAITHFFLLNSVYRMSLFARQEAQTWKQYSEWIRQVWSLPPLSLTYGGGGCWGPEKDVYFNPVYLEALLTLDPFVKSPLCWVLSVSFHSLHCPSERVFHWSVLFCACLIPGPQLGHLTFVQAAVCLELLLPWII